MTAEETGFGRAALETLRRCAQRSETAARAAIRPRRLCALASAVGASAEPELNARGLQLRVETSCEKRGYVDGDVAAAVLAHLIDAAAAEAPMGAAIVVRAVCGASRTTMIRVSIEGGRSGPSDEASALGRVARRPEIALCRAALSSFGGGVSTLPGPDGCAVRWISLPEGSPSAGYDRYCVLRDGERRQRSGPAPYGERRVR